MPCYEVTLITRPLAKTELVTVLHRAILAFLNNEAIIKNIQSLGHRDLPFRRVLKQSKEHAFTTNSVLINTYMPLQKMYETRTNLINDLDLLWIGVVNHAEKAELPEECNLEEMLRPPALRKSIQDLRDNQKMSKFTRQRIFKRTEKEWRAIPKSYTIAPPRF